MVQRKTYDTRVKYLVMKGLLPDVYGKQIHIGSPTAAHSLIQLNLIDGYWLFVNPIILGRGIPLFVDIEDKIKLKLLTVRQFTCGVTELNFTVDKQ